MANSQGIKKFCWKKFISAKLKSTLEVQFKKYFSADHCIKIIQSYSKCALRDNNLKAQFEKLLFHSVSFDRSDSLASEYVHNQLMFSLLSTSSTSSLSSSISSENLCVKMLNDAC